jgi:hypothetical protein
MLLAWALQPIPRHLKCSPANAPDYNEDSTKKAALLQDSATYNKQANPKLHAYFCQLKEAYFSELQHADTLF